MRNIQNSAAQNNGDGIPSLRGIPSNNPTSGNGVQTPPVNQANISGQARQISPEQTTQIQQNVPPKNLAPNQVQNGQIQPSRQIPNPNINAQNPSQNPAANPSSTSVKVQQKAQDLLKDVQNRVDQSTKDDPVEVKIKASTIGLFIGGVLGGVIVFILGLVLGNIGLWGYGFAGGAVIGFFLGNFMDRSN
ncbi:hypothetical protein LRY64_00155 [Candidatus Woesebacteria bacterium]|nr:hypothetical protein [Candidatus Woesebacteria bacterium]